MHKDDLVSCAVLTYNSASTVLETLDSIKEQTYKNIELIISDDCSKDNTIDICREWIERNKDRFVRTELLRVEKNTGVCDNFNRALFSCQGKWLKGIAADDIMFPDCIESFMSYVSEHREAKWVSSYVRTYNEIFDENNCIATNVVSDRSFFDLDIDGQLKRIAVWNMIQAPSLLFLRSMVFELGGYDKTYSFEDYPFFLKAIEHGYKCYFMDKETVGYRIHESISHSAGQLFNYKFLQESRRFHREKCFKYLSKKQIKGQHLIWKFQDIIESMNLNKNTPFMSFVYNKVFYLIRRLYD